MTTIDPDCLLDVGKKIYDMKMHPIFMACRKYAGLIFVTHVGDKNNRLKQKNMTTKLT